MGRWFWNLKGRKINSAPAFSFFLAEEEKKKVCHHLSEKFQSWRYLSPVGGFMRPRFSSQVVHRHQSSISSPLCLIFHLPVTLLACPSSFPPPPKNRLPWPVLSWRCRKWGELGRRRWGGVWEHDRDAAELYQHEVKAANVCFFWSPAVYPCT